MTQRGLIPAPCFMQEGRACTSHYPIPMQQGRFAALSLQGCDFSPHSHRRFPTTALDHPDYCVQLHSPHPRPITGELIHSCSLKLASLGLSFCATVIFFFVRGIGETGMGIVRSHVWAKCLDQEIQHSRLEDVGSNVCRQSPACQELYITESSYYRVFDASFAYRARQGCRVRSAHCTLYRIKLYS